MLCTQQAIHHLNFGEREGNPGSFPLRLAFDDPCEQLGGIWWGSTHYVLEIRDATRTHDDAIEVFQVRNFTVFVWCTINYLLQQAYYLANVGCTIHSLQRPEISRSFDL